MNEFAIKGVRLNKLLIDMQGPIARWYVEASLVTNNGKFIGQVNMASDGVLADAFAPSGEVQTLTHDLLVAVHQDIEKQLEIYV
jgi:hypothetical protein